MTKRSAPPMAKTCARSAPPKEKQETPKGSKNQKAPDRGAGLQNEEVGPPKLSTVGPNDLKRPERLTALYRQAVDAGWIDNSEVGFRNFVCAAVRATRAGGRVGAIFTGIIKKGLWHHITHDQEDSFRSLLQRCKGRDGRLETLHAPPLSLLSGLGLHEDLATLCIAEVLALSSLRPYRH